MTTSTNQPVYVLCVRTWFRQGSSYYSMRIVTPTGGETFTPTTYGHGYATAIHKAKEKMESLGFPIPEGARFIVDEPPVVRLPPVIVPVASIVKVAFTAFSK